MVSRHGHLPELVEKLNNKILSNLNLSLEVMPLRPELQYLIFSTDDVTSAEGDCYRHVHKVSIIFFYTIISLVYFLQNKIAVKILNFSRNI